MSNEEMDRAIAEAVGWKPVDVPGYFVCGIQTRMWQDPTGKRGSAPPSYSTDLNAMHEAEKAAFKGSTLWVEFAYNLLTVLQASEMSAADGMTCVLQATAEDHAKAFIETIKAIKP